ncbi:MAG: hypothetical protein IJH32_04260 [Ruminococcus sp.]|nr:hypothetical protein [Ruminococcus sp.]
MSEYNRELLTEREKEYFDCDVEMPSSASSAASLLGSVALSFIAALFHSVFVPSSSYGKADRRLMHNIRMTRYARYKQAVLRKAKGEPRRGDEKILRKLNKKDFVLEDELFDPDAFAAQLYEEYMKAHPELFDNDK